MQKNQKKTSKLYIKPYNWRSRRSLKKSSNPPLHWNRIDVYLKNYDKNLSNSLLKIPQDKEAYSNPGQHALADIFSPNINVHSFSTNKPNSFNLLQHSTSWKTVMCATASKLNSTDTEMMHFCFICSEPDHLNVVSVFYHIKRHIWFYWGKTQLSKMSEFANSFCFSFFFFSFPLGIMSVWDISFATLIVDIKHEYYSKTLAFSTLVEIQSKY